jgi:hypothetical protein
MHWQPEDWAYQLLQARIQIGPRIENSPASTILAIPQIRSSWALAVALQLRALSVVMLLSRNAIQEYNVSTIRSPISDGELDLETTRYTS